MENKNKCQRFPNTLPWNGPLLKKRHEKKSMFDELKQCV